MWLAFYICLLTSYLWYATFITSDPFKNCILFSSAPCLLVNGTRIFYLGTICRFSWNGTNVSQWRFHDNRHMNSSADVSKFQILPVHVKCLILLKPLLGGVDDSFHLPVTSMNMLNQSELAPFSFCRVRLFLRDSYLSLFYRQISVVCAVWRL
jgi:hypothetical protein